jgi:ABC-type Zn2+ transport system substrate-binding protein/surface adhesin
MDVVCTGATCDNDDDDDDDYDDDDDDDDDDDNDDDDDDDNDGKDDDDDDNEDRGVNVEDANLHRRSRGWPLGPSGLGEPIGLHVWIPGASKLYISNITAVKSLSNALHIVPIVHFGRAV